MFLILTVLLVSTFDIGGVNGQEEILSNPAAPANYYANLRPGDSARYKIFKVGLNEATWQIDANVLGIPTAHYKHDRIYLRDTQADHPYCYATYVNVIQNYAGSSTYGVSHEEFVPDELVGCPAGVK